MPHKWKDSQIRHRAWDELVRRGIKTPVTFVRTKVLEDAICEEMGWEPAGDPMETVHRFVATLRGVKKDEAALELAGPRVLTETGRELRLGKSYAMRLAMERIVDQPPMMSLASNVVESRPFGFQ